jgi:hypothetical protein
MPVNKEKLLGSRQVRYRRVPKQQDSGWTDAQVSQGSAASRSCLCERKGVVVRCIRAAQLSL